MKGNSGQRLRLHGDQTGARAELLGGVPEVDGTATVLDNDYQGIAHPHLRGQGDDQTDTVLVTVIQSGDGRAFAFISSERQTRRSVLLMGQGRSSTMTQHEL